jgi:hypothetical protein
VVSVAAATPAFAACSGTTNLSGTTISGSSTQDTNKKGYTITLTVDLVNSGQATNALTVVGSSSVGTIDTFESIGNVNTHWQHPSGGHTETLVAPTQVQCSATPTRVVFTVHVTVPMNAARPTITLNFTSTGGTGVVKTF